MPDVKNVNKILVYPKPYYLKWLKQRLHRNIESLDELKDGHVYLVLSSKLFPDHFGKTVDNESPNKNWKKLDQLFIKLNIVKTIDFDNLTSDTELVLL